MSLSLPLFSLPFSPTRAIFQNGRRQHSDIKASFWFQEVECLFCLMETRRLALLTLTLLALNSKQQIPSPAQVCPIGTDIGPLALSLRCVTKIQSIWLLMLVCQETTEVKRARKQET